MTDTPEAVRLADWLQAAVQTYPQVSADEPGGYCSEMDQMIDQAAAILRRIPELEADVQEQARLNGMGAERELALMALVSRLEAERDQLRAELDARWQPIETATEEDESGGQAWLLVDGVVVRGYFLSIPFQEYRDADGFYCGQQDAHAYWARAEDGEPVSPTHFQRITPPAAPTPPNADKKGQ